MSSDPSAFAIPYYGDSTPLLNALRSKVVSGFLKKCVSLADSQELSASLENSIVAIDELKDTRGLFIPEMSILMSGLGKDAQFADDPYWSVQQGLIATHLSGLSEKVEFDLRSENPILILGRAVTLQGGKIRGDRKSVSIIDNTGAEVWSLFNDNDLGSPPTWYDNFATSPILLPDNKTIIVTPDGWHEIVKLQSEIVAPDHAVISQLNEAFGFMHEHMPVFYDWTTKVLNQVSPMRRPAPNTIASNSSSFRWGGIDVAAPATLTETIEMLVHECSHQYFHLLCWAGPVTIPEAKSYYSPLKDIDRPLEKILLGYHSFVNVELAFRELKYLGFGSDIRDRRSTVKKYLSGLSSPLKDTMELSNLGLQVYIPMEEAMLTEA